MRLHTSKQRIRRLGTVPTSGRPIDVCLKQVGGGSVLELRPRGMRKNGVVSLSLQDVVLRLLPPQTTNGLSVTVSVAPLDHPEFSWVKEMTLPLRPAWSPVLEPTSADSIAA